MTAVDQGFIDYIVVCISEFASHCQMPMRDAYLYLRDYKGIDFLEEFYEIEHTLSFEEAVDDLTAICRRNGGGIL